MAFLFLCVCVCSFFYSAVCVIQLSWSNFLLNAKVWTMNVDHIISTFVNIYILNHSEKFHFKKRWNQMCLLSIFLYTFIDKSVFVFSSENCRAAIKSCVAQHHNGRILQCVLCSETPFLLWVFSAIQFAHESKTHFVLMFLVWLSVT